MAWEINIGYDITLPAAANLSAKQYYFVTVDSNAKAALSIADEQSLGVLQNDPTSGKGAAVRVMGVSKVVYGGSITAGDKITSDAAGKAVKATAASVSAGTPEPLAGSHVIGIALKSGASGETGSIALVHAGLTN